jgi:AcrR family transcriptional regulator
MKATLSKQDAAARTRHKLIEAAIQIVQQQGASGLTLDSVAHKAEMSKGGLLHHFRSKEALIGAILDHLLEAFEARVTALVNAEAVDGRPGGLTRAYIRATFESDDLALELGTMLISDIVGSAALMNQVNDDFARWRERLLNDGLPKARVLVIQMAADHFWSERALAGNTSGFLATNWQAIRDELIALTGYTQGDNT